MTRLVLQATENGLLIDQDVLRTAGVGPGDLVEVEVAALPTSREIQVKALRHVVWTLGDAIRLGPAQWSENAWVIELIDPQGEVQIGELVLDAHGEVVASRSATADSVRQRFYAARPPRPAA